MVEKEGQVNVSVLDEVVRNLLTRRMLSGIVCGSDCSSFMIWIVSHRFRNVIIIMISTLWRGVFHGLRNVMIFSRRFDFKMRFVDGFAVPNLVWYGLYGDELICCGWRRFGWQMKVWLLDSPCPPVTVSKWFWRWMWPWDCCGVSASGCSTGPRCPILVTSFMNLMQFLPLRYVASDVGFRCVKVVKARTRLNEWWLRTSGSSISSCAVLSGASHLQEIGVDPGWPWLIRCKRGGLDRSKWWGELGGVELSWAGSNVPGNFAENCVGEFRAIWLEMCPLKATMALKAAEIVTGECCQKTRGERTKGDVSEGSDGSEGFDVVCRSCSWTRDP